MGAFYAQAGMTGPLRLLESEIGYFSTAATKSFPGAVLDRETWYVGAPRRKRHATCGYTHSTIDVIASLRRDGTPFMAADEITVEVPPYILPGVVKSAPPDSPGVARFHLQYCAALAACGADTILPEHSLELEKNLARPEVRQIMERIHIVPNPALTHYHQCNVALLERDGEVLAHRQGRGPRGTPQNPMPDEEVIAKFRGLVSHKLSPHHTEEYLQRFTTLAHQSDWHWLVAAFDTETA